MARKTPDPRRSTPVAGAAASTPEAKAHYDRGLALARAGNWQEAASAYRQAIALEPTRADAHNNLGNALLMLARNGEAVAAYRSALALKPTLAEAHNNLGNALLREGNRDAAVAAFRSAIAVRAEYPEAHYNLGAALAITDRYDEAATAYRRAIKLRPKFPEAHNNLANMLLALGRNTEAAAACRQALALRPDFVEARSNLGHALLALGHNEKAADAFRAALALRPQDADARYNLGNALAASGRTEEAIPEFHQALALKPHYPEVHNNLGNALFALGRNAEAEMSFRSAIAGRPGFAEAHTNLGSVLAKLDRDDDALASYREALGLKPDFVPALNNLSILLLKLERPAEALAASQRAAALAPNDADTQHYLANAHRDCLQWPEAARAYRKAFASKGDDPTVIVSFANALTHCGETEEAHTLFRRAYRVRPVTTVPAVTKAEFQVLLLTAPGPSNTASNFILGRANYDAHFLIVVDGVGLEKPAEIDALRQKADVTVNLISDADVAGQYLELAGAIADRIGRPVVNHPALMAATGRDAIAERLQGIADCRMPRTRRIARAAPSDIAERLAGLSLPLLLRVSGTHGGETMAKIDDLSAAAAFCGRWPGAVYYASEYVPYESADGYFRKYRFVFVDGAIFPYHLAIASQWKVHHYSTDMANQAWMRDEEAAFVAAPDRFFGPRPWQALEAIRARIGLDYFGIDCALDSDGALVVFEVNATMRIHGERGVFAYKQPYVERIQHAFDAMLVKRI